jgi:hypothetical protein
LTSLAAEAAAEVEVPKAFHGVLVLTNGNLLRGIILREGDVYRVSLSQSELLVPLAQVDMLCRSVDEAYEQRRRQRAGSSADSHVELARWCLRHDLLQYASRELLDARTIDPEHRQLTNVERQLQLALRNREAKPQPTTPAEIAPAANEDHAELLQTVPDWARTLFVRQIQPLLVESCAASGCHQPEAQEPFHLNRLALDGPGHPATTLSNLASTLEQLDLESPDNSALLLQAKTEHGGGDGASPHALEAYQYHMLRIWVEQLAAAKNKVADPAVELAAHEEGIPGVKSTAVEPGDPFDPDEFHRLTAAAPADATPSPVAHPESE